MPPKTAASAPSKGTGNFTEDYLADWGSDDDPFAGTPSPEPANKKNDKKRKGDDILGIDEQIDLTKKARVPRIKLDENRLLSDKGIPELQRRAKKLRLKGKGHEFSDAARLLSFYQQWLDDLFPKATFLDALAMVEKAGHKTQLKLNRMKWIDDLKPKPSVSTSLDDDDPFAEPDSAVPRQPSRIAPIFEKATSAAAALGAGTSGNDHPGDDDLFGDDDIYNATPKRDVQSRPAGDDVPDDDDLDALMAEAEANETTAQNKDTTRRTVPTSFGSIFGGGGVTASKPAPQPTPSAEPDDDDLEALMAEAEAEAQVKPAPPQNTGGSTSIFGGGAKPKEAPATIELDDDDDDLDALMAEAEAMAAPPTSKPKDAATETTAPPTSAAAGEKSNEAEKPKAIASEDYEDDDLDALMAEAEAQGLSSTSHAAASKPTEGQRNDKDKDTSFENEEEAMAEMDGLW
ncbi:Replication Fork Protection Component Swi3 domain containing protein [Naviculisporaceae sp. PSN 640]